jgi:hypothetical protein
VIGCVAKHVPSSNPIPGVGIVVKRNPGTSADRDIAVNDTGPTISARLLPTSPSWNTRW